MELPFYYTLKEFEENYKNDLKFYINNYPSADESDLLSELKDSYDLFVSKTDKYRFLGYKVKLDIVSGFSEFNPIYEDRYFDYNQYLDKLKGKIGTYLFENNILLSKVHREDFSILYYGCQYYQNGIHRDEFGNDCIDLFDDEIHSKLERFFYLDEKNNIICNKFGLKDFEISAVKIVKIIDSKLNSQKFSNLFSSETKDDNNTNRDSDEKTQNKYSVPQIIKILDKLNIKGMMGEKGFTDFQTVQLLADIFDRSEKSIRNNFDSDTHKNTAETYISDLKNLKAKR